MTVGLTVSNAIADCVVYLCRKQLVEAEGRRQSAHYQIGGVEVDAPILKYVKVSDAARSGQSLW